MTHKHNCFEEMVIRHLKGKSGEELDQEMNDIVLTISDHITEYPKLREEIIKLINDSKHEYTEDEKFGVMFEVVNKIDDALDEAVRSIIKKHIL